MSEKFDFRVPEVVDKPERDEAKIDLPERVDGAVEVPPSLSDERLKVVGSETLRALHEVEEVLDEASQDDIESKEVTVDGESGELSQVRVEVSGDSESIGVADVEGGQEVVVDYTDVRKSKGKEIIKSQVKGALSGTGVATGGVAAIAALGLGGMAIGAPAVGAAAGGAAGAALIWMGGVRIAQNLRGYRPENTSSWVSSRNHHIEQGVVESIGLSRKLPRTSLPMAVYAETLNLAMNLPAADKKGKEIRYGMTTHGAIIKNFESAEELGLINITKERKKDIFGHEVSSRLVMEKLTAGTASVMDLFSKKRRDEKFPKTEMYYVKFTVNEGVHLTESDVMNPDDRMMKLLSRNVEKGRFRLDYDEDGNLKYALPLTKKELAKARNPVPSVVQ